MSKPTTIKEAISKWEHHNGQKVSQTKDLKLIGIIPPIEKMETFAAISHLEKLSLSTNCIEKINNLNVFKNLKILSLGRNYIKHLTGLEVVAETLVELWISYNLVEKLTGLTTLKKLKVFYVSNNSIKDWVEFQKLAELTSLEDLLFVGNPLEEKHSVDGTWRKEVSRRLPNLKKLDGVPVIRDNDEETALFAKVQNKDLDSKPAGNATAEQSASEQIQ